MDLTTSYQGVVPQPIRDRYRWLETRNAAAVLEATNPQEWSDILEVLDKFKLDVDRDIKTPGRNESPTAAHLNRQFRDKGWREGFYKVNVRSNLTLLPYAAAGETAAIEDDRDIDSSSYLVDNLKGRVALDVEWHAKDGNLDRDIAAYRSLYAETIIDAGVMITMHRAEMRDLAIAILGATMPNGKPNTKFETSTTTNVEKMVDRLRRGDSGGCPVLVAGICPLTV